MDYFVLLELISLVYSEVGNYVLTLGALAGITQVHCEGVALGKVVFKKSGVTFGETWFFETCAYISLPLLNTAQGVAAASAFGMNS